MTVIGEAFVDVKPKTDNFSKDTEKGVSSGLGSVAKKVAIGFGAVLAAGSAVHFVGEFVKAAAEAQKISRVTDAILQSTGSAAGLSATQVGDLATSLSNLTGIDDDVIQAAENILLTFTSVRDAAGEGNDIFSRTTEAALNMATVLGGDPTSAIQQLGKALNDPAEGLTKLTRSGVVFTQQQKDMVEQLVAAGDTLGAQKIILDELDKEFGGAAAAAADPFDRLKVATDNLKESIGGALIPVLAPAATALANLVSNNQEAIAGGITRAFDALGSVIRFLEPGVRNVARAFQFMFEQIEPVVSAIAEFVSDHLPSLSGALAENTPLVEAFSTAIVAIATSFAAIGVASAALGPLAPVASLLGGLAEFVPILGAAAGPLLVIAAAFAAAAAGGVLLFQRVDAVREAFEQLFGETLAPFAAALTFLNPFVPLAVGAKALFDNVEPVRNVIHFLVDSFRGLADVVGGIASGAGLGDVFAGISDALASIDLSGISDIAATVGGAIAGGFTSTVSAIRGALAPAVQFLTDVWAKYGDEVTGILVGFRDIAIAVFERAAALIGVFAAQIANVASVIIDLVGPAFQVLGAVIEITLAPLGAVISGALGFAQVAFETFIGVVGPAWEALWGLVSSVVANVLGPLSDIIEGFLGVIRGFVDIVAGLLTLDWERIWSGVGEIAGAAIEITRGIMEVFLGFLAAVWSNAETLLTLPFVIAWATIQGVVDAAVVVVTAALQGVINFVSSVWANIGTFLTAPVEAAKVVIEGLIAAVVLLFAAMPGQVAAALGSFAGAIVGVITGAVGAVVGAVTSLVSSAVAEIALLPGKAATALASLGTSIAGAIASAATQAVQAAGTLVSSVVEKIGELPGRVASVIGGVASAIADGVKDAVKGALNTVIRTFNSLSDIDTLFGTIGLPDIPTLAVGGVIGGTTLAVLHRDEVVLNSAQQAQLLFALANGGARRGGGDTFIDASFTVNGSVVGVDDLDARFDAQADRLADIIGAGRMGGS